MESKREKRMQDITNSNEKEIDEAPQNIIV